ncbi:MAG: arsenate reductase [Flavobacteriaceae bacterium]|jgi:arsenate reductase
MHYKENELTLLYNKERELDRKTLATAHVLTTKINRQEVSTTRLSETLYYIAINKLGGSPKSIIDKSKPYYQNELRGLELSEYGWYSIMMKHPELWRAPVALYKGRAVLCTSSNDVLKLS